MEPSYTKEFYIVPSLCDSEGKLGRAQTFQIFQDIAGEHAEFLGVGAEAMAARQRFWLTVRTRVRFYQRPNMMRHVSLTTWPSRPESMRGQRCYTLKAADTLLAEGETEWAVLDTKSGKLANTASAGMPTELAYVEKRIFQNAYPRINPTFLPQEQVGRYRVLPSDTDMGQHMNNVAYVRMLLDTFSTKEQETLQVSEMEISFRSPCKEGETLEVFRRETEEGMEFLIRRPEGNAGALARLIYQ